MKEVTEKKTGFAGKALKVIVWCLVICAGLLAAVQIVLSPSTVNRIIDKYAHEYVDGEINIDKVRLSLIRSFPDIGLAVEGFSITGHDRDTLVSFDKFSASMNVYALARGCLDIPSADLSGLYISARRYPDGTANWDMIQIPSDTTESETSFPELKLGRISLTGNPRIAYTDHKDSIFLSTCFGQMSIEGRKDTLHFVIDSDASLKFAPFKVSAVELEADKTIEIHARGEGDYIYPNGGLHSFDASLKIPESEIIYTETGDIVSLVLDLSASKDKDGLVSATLDKVILLCNGLKLQASGSVPDLMDEDPLVRLDGRMSADLSRIGRFIPDSIGISSSGSLTAALNGDIRLSQMDLYRFSESGIKGGISGKDISIKIPKDSIDITFDEFDIAIEPETMKSRIDSSLAVRLMGIHGMIGKARLAYGLMGVEGERVNISAKSSIESDTTKVNTLGGRINAASLALTDASGVEVIFRDTENGFQMLPKKGRSDVPLLTFNSRNSRIMLKDGTNRIILTDAKFGATAAMNTVERRLRGRMFLDSLAKAYPDIPRDSLMFHLRSQRLEREIPEWLTEEDFKKQDLDIKLDETLAKYFREWDLTGDIDVRTGILMTPYFPVRNILRGLEVTFDNNRIGIDSIKVRSGDSEIAAKGELTGLRRALLGRGGLKLDLDIMSDKMNANELLTAYNTGSRYVPPQDKEAVAEVSDAEFFKMVTSDSLSVNDSITPLIVVPSNLNAEIRINASDISYSDLNISRMHSEMTMKERCVQIRNTEAVSNMGDIGFEGFYATRSKKNIKAGFSFNFKDISAEKVIKMMPAVDTHMPLLKSFNGSLDCELAATAAIDTNMNIITPSINGIIRISGSDLSIKESDMFRDLAKKLMFKNRNEGYIKEMSVEGVISDNMLEVFPFILELDRYTLALSGIHNMDESYRYHASVLKSPFIIRLGVDVYGDNLNDMKFKIGKAKYKNTNIPVFSSVIDTTKINLVNSIRGIFEKGVEAAVNENERREAIEKHKEEIGYVRAIDQNLEALSKNEEEQINEIKNNNTDE